MSEAKARELLTQLDLAAGEYVADWPPSQGDVVTLHRLLEARKNARAYLAAVPAPPAGPPFALLRAMLLRRVDAGEDIFDVCGVCDASWSEREWHKQHCPLDAAPAAEPVAQPEVQCAHCDFYGTREEIDAHEPTCYEPVAQQPPPRDLLAKMRALRDALADIEGEEMEYGDAIKLGVAASVARGYIKASEAHDD